MKKIIFNIKAFLKFFRVPIFYTFNSDYDKLLNDCMDSGIKRITGNVVINEYDNEPVLLKVTFNNCVKLEFWNASKWVGWGTRASATINSINLLEVTDSRPSIQTLYRMYLLTKPHRKVLKVEPKYPNILKIIESNKHSCKDGK